jgi:SRSO17 transposase
METHTAAIPHFVHAFANQFDAVFSRPVQKLRFCQYLTALLLQTERRNTHGIERLVAGTDDQAIHHFLANSPWDHEEMNELRVKLLNTLAQTCTRPEGVLILDDSGSPRRGTKIANTQRQYIGQVGKTANGYVLVTTHYADAAKHWPVDLAPYRPQAWIKPGEPVRTKYEIGLELVKTARDTHGLRFQAVVVDPWYGRSSGFLQQLAEEKLTFVAALERRAKVTTKLPTDPFRDTPHRVEDALGAFRPEDFEPVTWPTSKGPATRWVVEFRGHRDGLSGKQRFLLVVEDPQAPAAGDPWFLMTNAPRETVSAAQVVQLYQWRNWIEEGYKESKQELGANECVCVGERTQVRHWLLVFAAHSLVTLLRSGGELQSFCRRTLGTWHDHLRAIRDWCRLGFDRWKTANPDAWRALCLERTGFLPYT